MTPDEAPGPWEWADCDDEGGGTHMALRNPAGEKALHTVDAESYASWVEGAPEDLRLTAAAPALAAMVAGMREEWGVEYAGVNHGGRHTEWGYETHDEAERQARRYRLCTDMHPVHVVRRYVTTPEEA